MITEENNLRALYLEGIKRLEEQDFEMYSALRDEYERQNNELMMVASCSVVSPEVLACLGSHIVNVTAEGYPGKRYHAGCREVDRVESLAIERAKSVFHAKYANVQPHSATTANEIVLFSLLNSGDTILGMEMQSGGHLSHGANVSFSGKCFHAEKYGLDNNFLIDYDEVEKKAQQCLPKLIICGTTAYPRKINFKRFREIADSVDAYLVADVSHIAGLILAGKHESPIDWAHVTTTCTHKQLMGPRGGLILSGEDYNTKLKNGEEKTIADHFQTAVFPFFQGAPVMNMIAAKSAALKICQTVFFKSLMIQIVANAKSLSTSFQDLGYHVTSGGTDNHLILIDLTEKNITGSVAEKALEECGIIVNKNSIPNKKLKIKEPMGIRLGTNSLTQRGCTESDMVKCAQLIDKILSSVVMLEENYMLPEGIKYEVRKEVYKICQNHRLPDYP